MPSVLLRMTWGVIRKMSSVRLVFIGCRPEEAAQHRNIHKIGNAVLIGSLIFGDHPTDCETVSILNYSRCLRLADIKSWEMNLLFLTAHDPGPVYLAHLDQYLQIHQPLGIDLRNDSDNSTGVLILDRRTRCESSSSWCTC